MAEHRKKRRSRAAEKEQTDRQGTRFHYSFLKILSGSDLSRRRLPYMEACSERKGPTLWLTACCHGDEVGGIVVVQEVFKWLKRIPLLRGRVCAFPLMNPLGFEAAARHVPFSKEDLNRCFPGSAEGSLAQRIAARIFQNIVETKPDVVLDLHNDWIRSIPYAVLDPLPAKASKDLRQRLQEIAEATGFPVVHEPQPLQGSLSHSLLETGIPAVTLELSESFVVNENIVQQGKRAIENILVMLRMIETSNEPFRYPLPETISGERLRYSHLPLSSTSGVLRFLIRPGTFVRAGQPLAKVYNAFGRLQETLRARNDGIVLGVTDSSVAFPGAPVFAMGEIESRRVG